MRVKGCRALVVLTRKCMSPVLARWYSSAMPQNGKRSVPVNQAVYEYNQPNICKVYVHDASVYQQIQRPVVGSLSRSNETILIPKQLYLHAGSVMYIKHRMYRVSPRCRYIIPKLLYRIVYLVLVYSVISVSNNHQPMGCLVLSMKAVVRGKL